MNSEQNQEMKMTGMCVHGNFPDTCEACKVQQTPEKSENQELSSAKQYWDKTLANEVRISTSQDPKCEVSIVVPVYNETPDNLMRQIDAFKKQDISPESFEIIYVVNNDVGTKAVQENNQKVIEALKSVEGLNINIIDKSSEGNEIKDCNVGKARNRGMAEASIRFQENNKDGIIVQTDADSFPSNETYLSDLVKTMNQEEGVVGAAGGIAFEIDAEKYGEEEIKQVLTMLKWQRLVDAIAHPDAYANEGEINFSGANMISRSLESAAIGGVPEWKAGEDSQFGRNLESYAAKNSGKVLNARDSLKMVTQLRDSDRTALSLKSIFDRVKSGDPLKEVSPITGDLVDVTEDTYNQVIEHYSEDQIIQKVAQVNESYIESLRFKKN